MDLGPMHGLTLLVLAFALFVEAVVAFALCTMLAMTSRGLGRRKREALLAGVAAGAPAVLLACVALLVDPSSTAVGFVEWSALPAMILGAVLGVRCAQVLRGPLEQP